MADQRATPTAPADPAEREETLRDEVWTDPWRMRVTLLAEIAVTLGVAWWCLRPPRFITEFVHAGQPNPMYGLVFALFLAGVVSTLLSNIANVRTQATSRELRSWMMVSTFLVGLSILPWFMEEYRYLGPFDISVIIVGLSSLISFMAAYGEAKKLTERGVPRNVAEFWTRYARGVYGPTLVGLALVTLVSALLHDARHPEFVDAWRAALPRPDQMSSDTFWATYVSERVLPMQVRAFWDGFGTGAAAIQILAGQFAGYFIGFDVLRDKARG